MTPAELAGFCSVPAHVLVTEDGDEIVILSLGRDGWRYFVRSATGAILGSGTAAESADAKREALAVVAVPFG